MFEAFVIGSLVVLWTGYLYQRYFREKFMPSLGLYDDFGTIIFSYFMGILICFSFGVPNATGLIALQACGSLLRINQRITEMEKELENR